MFPIQMWVSERGKNESKSFTSTLSASDNTRPRRELEDERFDCGIRNIPAAIPSTAGRKKKKNLLILARTYTVHTVIRCQKEQMDRWHEHYGGKEHLAASLQGNWMLWKPLWCSLMFSVSRGAGSDATSRFQSSSRELFNRADWH